MGDRGEVKLSYGLGKGDIFFYTHWSGYRLPVAVRDALQAGEPRWGDEPYLGRILVSQLVGDQWDQELSYGLAPYHMDSEYPPLEVNVHDSIVTINGKSYSFTEYLALTDNDLQAHWGGR